MGDMSVGLWLGEMKARLDAFRAHMKVVEPKIAPRFNTFNYLRRDEYGMSRIIADLLDPCGDHAQGDVFLRAFLERFWPGQSLSGTGDKPVVGLEVITHNQRRLDIQVKFNGGQTVLGIENKIRYAPDQENQVKDYLEHVRLEHLKANGSAGSYLLIYLTPDGYEPSAYSMGVANDEKNTFLDEQREHLGMLGCRDLAEWLRDCVGLCESLRVQAFLNDLVRFIKTSILGESDMNEQALIVDAAMESGKHVEMALQVAHAAAEIRHRNFGRFRDEVTQRVTGRKRIETPEGWGLYYPENKNEMDRAYSINLGPVPKRSNDYAIRLQFDGPRMQWVVIGIASDLPHCQQLEEVTVALEDRIGGGKLNDNHWPWYVKFEHHDGWLAPAVQKLLWDTSDNGMAAKVVAKFRQILEAIRNHEETLLEKFRRP